MYIKAYGFIALLFIDNKIKKHGFKNSCESIRSLKNSKKNFKPKPENLHNLHSLCKEINELCDRHLFVKKAECLHQSILAASILLKKGYHIDLKIGVSKKDFSAHAWVEYDGKILNDQPEVHNQYNVILSI
ncbi:lasso peptide biosynthesis B2 protein [Rossellomorea aquimaris]|uniref:lasso peptide biosynthesis B2 protein n=1 Tax=Rossellomorea aquimaris TaxID=189382 RepID=UPI0037C7A810